MDEEEEEEGREGGSITLPSWSPWAIGAGAPQQDLFVMEGEL